MMSRMPPLLARSGLNVSFFGRLICDHFHDLPPIHDRLGNASRHSRGYAQDLVDANPVLPDRIDRDYVGLVLEFLA